MVLSDTVISIVVTIGSGIMAVISTRFLLWDVVKKLFGIREDRPTKEEKVEDAGVAETNAFTSKSATLDELREKRRIDRVFKTVSFTLAIIMSIIGAIILFGGILICFFTEKEIGWITTSSGAIVELVAGIHFLLVRQTMKEVKDNSKQLEKAEDLLTALELVEKISDAKTKDETYEKMIDKLLANNDK